MSIISSLNIARDALAVNQAAITVVSNNIANVDTEGYSKLRVNQASRITTSDNPGNSAIIQANSLSGVTLDSITRYADAYVQSCYWEQNSTVEYYNEYSKVAGNIEDLMNELNDTGLADALDTFYSSVNALNSDPDDITARTNYVSAAENLCSVFNSVSSSLTYLQKSLVGTASNVASSDIATEVDQVNELVDQIAEINEHIISTNTEDSSVSALLDKRDSLITELSSLINITTKENDNGTINISIGNRKLIESSQVEGYLKVSNSLDSDDNIITTISVVDPDDSTNVLLSDINDYITGGSIAAILDVCGTDSTKLTIKGALDDLNSMASAFAEVINSIQMDEDAYCMTTDGTALSSADTVAFFVNGDTSTSTNAVTTNITAANISVNSAVVNSPYLIAAANLTTFDSTAVGNGSNIEKVTTARTDSSYYAGTDLEDTTLEGYLTTSVSSLGVDVKSIEDSYGTQNAVLSTISSNLSSITGVNLDEELADLIKYQRAYEAAARVFSVCNDLLEGLVNLGK